ncbi:DUF5908 family protein [Paraflavitalea speifideaquila]|uniref:DUF5908 family protein n=1 Tax=Paraflavitalea speifideaquila TaxID=3076558 RepID=UPI0028E9336A|nr:DUF5908 family protein [Paraflavitalea speifideiaquila]
MPIEIRELQIKATVQDTIATAESTNAAADSETRMQEIIAVCVEQVLNIIKEKQER